MTITVRKYLCADTLISDIHHCFQKIPDPRELPDKASISFTDVLMSGLAVFGLKFPSLLKYDQNRHTLDHNLLSLYHITQPLQILTCESAWTNWILGLSALYLKRCSPNFNEENVWKIRISRGVLSPVLWMEQENFPPVMFVAHNAVKKNTKTVL